MQVCDGVIEVSSLGFRLNLLPEQLIGKLSYSIEMPSLLTFVLLLQTVHSFSQLSQFST